MKDIELHTALLDLYKMLREEGFQSQLGSLSKLIYAIETNDKKSFRKHFRSREIWGGSGSIRDISLRNPEKQKKIEAYLEQIRIKGKKYSSRWW